MNFVRMINRHEYAVHLGNRILKKVQLIRSVPPAKLSETLESRNSLLCEFVKENDKIYEEWDNNRRAIQRNLSDGIPSKKNLK